MSQQIETLEHGMITKIACGDMNVRVYSTKDAIEDQVIILDRQGKGIIIELPCFHDSIAELTKYLADNKLEIVGKLVSYHAAGSSFLPDVKNYLTESAVAYNTDGEGAHLVQNFSGVFGAAFDSGIINAGEKLNGGKMNIAGIDIEIIPNGDAFEVCIPAAKAVYVHMIGHDCHSIVAGAVHADALVANLQGYLDKGIEIFLSSHYVPETRKDVETKIAYLNDLKAIASECGSGTEFEEKVMAKYPNYSGLNYLDMSAGFFFPN